MLKRCLREREGCLLSTLACFISSHLPVYPPDPLAAPDGPDTVPQSPLRANLPERSRYTLWSPGEYPHNSLCFCLSRSSGNGNDTEGLTVQFSHNGWQLSPWRPGAGSFPVDLYIYQERDASGACSPPSRIHWGRLLLLLISIAGPLGRDAAACWCDPTCSSPLCAYQANYSPPPPPPLLISAFFRVQELLIYIFGHDASQLAVVSPSACHWYDSPPSSLPLNDFLLPLASLPLSSCALHDKSGRSLHPSKANDHHLFPFSPVTAASLAMHTCSKMHVCF